MSLGQTIDNQIQQSTQDAVRKAVAPLLDEIADLKERLIDRRDVLYYKDAVRYFGSHTKPQRIKDLMRGRQLPRETPVPLPAQKQGHDYFVRVEDLMRWQMGECTEADLYDWQVDMLENRSQ